MMQLQVRVTSAGLIVNDKRFLKKVMRQAGQDVAARGAVAPGADSARPGGRRPVEHLGQGPGETVGRIGPGRRLCHCIAPAGQLHRQQMPLCPAVIDNQHPP